MNKDLLLKIFKIPSMSHDEHAMSAFIKGKLSEYGVPYTQDSIGNIFNTTYY